MASIDVSSTLGGQGRTLQPRSSGEQQRTRVSFNDLAGGGRSSTGNIFYQLAANASSDGDVAGTADAALGAGFMTGSMTFDVGPATHSQPLLSSGKPKKSMVEQGYAVKRKTIVELEKDEGNTKASKWLKSSRGKILQFGMLAFFLIVDSAKTMVDAWALKDICSVAFCDERASRTTTTTLTVCVNPNIAQPMIVMQSAIALVISVALSAWFGGVVVHESGEHGRTTAIEALKMAFDCDQLLRCLPVGIAFSLSQTFSALAFVHGLKPATYAVLGNLYVPLCAFLSRWLFLRRYGWLEVIALSMLTLSSLTFAELSNENRGALGGDHSHTFERVAVMLSFASTTLSCIGSLFTEKIVKQKYTASAANTPFYIQKVRLEVGGLFTALLLVLFFWDENTSWPDLNSNPKIWLCLALRVLQGWMAGFLAKKLSTVSKAVCQSSSLLLVYFIGDELLSLFVVDCFNRTQISNITVTALALLVALVALLYQTGRKGTRASAPHAEEATAEFLRKGFLERADVASKMLASRALDVSGLRSIDESGNLRASRMPNFAGIGVTGEGISRWVSDRRPSLHRKSTASAETGDPANPQQRANVLIRWFVGSKDAPDQNCINSNREALFDSEFNVTDKEGRAMSQSSVHQRRCPTWEDFSGVNLLDQGWVQQVQQRNAAITDWLSSSSGQLLQVACVLFFVLADAGRTMCKEWFWRQPEAKDITPQTVVVVGSFVSVCTGLAVSVSLDGWAGWKGAMDLKDARACLPVAACFSLAQTCAALAFSFGLPGLWNTVLGYTYMPLSAVLTTFMFNRKYEKLEWLALFLICLSAFVFVQLLEFSELLGIKERVVMSTTPRPTTTHYFPPFSPRRRATTTLYRTTTTTTTTTYLDEDDASGQLLLGVIFCFASVVFACFGSLAAEKVMKASDKPFYQQKVYMDLGGLLTACMMLFVVGNFDTRSAHQKIRSCPCYSQEPAFWKLRTLLDGTLARCPPAGWGFAAFLNMAVEQVQAWLGGLVAKRLSSVVKSIAQAISLLIVYFVGELIFKGTEFWWPIGSMSFVMALSVLLFSNAKSPPEKEPTPVKPEAEIFAKAICEEFDMSEEELEAIMSYRPPDLNGRWCRPDDSSKGYREIQGTVLTWNGGTTHALVISPDGRSFTVAGQSSLRAELREDDKIHWTDGDVWSRDEAERRDSSDLPDHWRRANRPGSGWNGATHSSTLPQAIPEESAARSSGLAGLVSVSMEMATRETDVLPFPSKVDGPLKR